MTDAEQKNTKVLVVATHKGGAGKTTACVHLAAELGRAGLKVLLVDMDPQFNASSHIGLKHPSEVSVTTAELLLSGTDSSEALIASIQEDSRFENVSVIYGGLKLDQAAFQLNFGTPRPNEVLREKLEPMNGVFDVIIIDTPPSLGLLTTNALAMATHVIIPVESGSQYGMYGSADLALHLNRIRKINPEMRLIGALLLRHDERQLLCRAIKETAEREFGKVIPIKISSSSKFNRAASENASIHKIDRSSKVAREFRALSCYVAAEMGIHIGDDSGETEAA